jgi:hypothetical protein
VEIALSLGLRAHVGVDVDVGIFSDTFEQTLYPLTCPPQALRGLVSETDINLLAITSDHGLKS